MPSPDAAGLLEAGHGPISSTNHGEKTERPSWLRRFIWAFYLNPPGTLEQPLRRTAYLDGLRGFMAFLVYIHHNELWAHAASLAGDDEIFESAYGYNNHYRFAALPFVRNFFTGGHIAVAVFFVISGYVLSAKPLSLIHGGDTKRLLDSVASSIFRRWFRLYIPIIITTFVYVTSWHVPGYWVSNCKQASNLWDEWWNWYVEFKNFSFLFKEGPVWVTYNTHLWSIALEMRGSIIVFCAMAALYRATHFYRLLSWGALTFYFLYITDAYYCALFTMGVLICDLDIMASHNSLSYPAILRRIGDSKHARAWYYVLFITGLFLAGCPSHTNDVQYLRRNPMWYYLSFLKPQAVFDHKWFYLFWASTFIVIAVPRIPWVKRFFESAFCQYLGQISYALYLVHGPVLSSLGDRVYNMAGWVRAFDADKTMLAPYMNRFPLPRAGPMGLEISFLLPQFIIFPVTFFLANIVTRHVDNFAVQFPNRLYKLMTAPDNSVPVRSEDSQRLA